MTTSNLAHWKRIFIVNHVFHKLIYWGAKSKSCYLWSGPYIPLIPFIFSSGNFPPGSYIFTIQTRTQHISNFSRLDYLEQDHLVPLFVFIVIVMNPQKVILPVIHKMFSNPLWKSLLKSLNSKSLLVEKSQL